MAPVTGVIFDLDGTLANTPSAITSTMTEILIAMGRQPDEATVLATVGKPLDQNFALLLAVPADHADVAEAMERYKVQFGGYVARTGAALLYPDVAAGLAELRDAGLRLGLATSKVHIAATRMLAATGVADLFDVVAGHDSVARGKPNPDMALYVAEHLGCSPADCVVVGDAEGDIQMAVAAGMRAIGVSYGVATTADLTRAGAAAVVDSFPELVLTLLQDVSSLEGSHR